jgi:hypothetical protein
MVTSIHTLSPALKSGPTAKHLSISPSLIHLTPLNHHPTLLDDSIALTVACAVSRTQLDSRISYVIPALRLCSPETSRPSSLTLFLGSIPTCVR